MIYMTDLDRADDRRWRREPTWIDVVLSETSIQAQTDYAILEAVARVTAHLASRYPGVAVEVTTRRKPAPYDDPHHYTATDQRRPFCLDLTAEVYRALRMRQWGATPVPETLWADIAAVARRRRDTLDAVITGLGAP